MRALVERDRVDGVDLGFAGYQPGHVPLRLADDRSDRALRMEMASGRDERGDAANSLIVVHSRGHYADKICPSTFLC